MKTKVKLLIIWYSKPLIEWWINEWNIDYFLKSLKKLEQSLITQKKDFNKDFIFARYSSMDGESIDDKPRFKSNRLSINELIKEIHYFQKSSPFKINKNGFLIEKRGYDLKDEV